MCVLDDGDVLCCQRRVDLPRSAVKNDERSQVARAEPIQLQSALGVGGVRRAEGDGPIEADIDWSFPVSCQATSAVAEGDRDFGGEDDPRAAQKIMGDCPLMVCTDRPEVEAAFVRPQQW